MSPTTVGYSNTNGITPEALKKPPKDLLHHLSYAARRRKANQYKLFYKYYEIPGLQDISGGLPHPSLFPIQSLGGQALAADHLERPGAPKHVLGSTAEELEVGLQYGQASGLPEVEQWLQDFTNEYIAEAPYQGGFRSLITHGSTDGWSKVLQVLTNEWRDTDSIETREGLLVEEFTYAIAAEVACVRGLNVTSVPIDDQGIIPGKLREILANWDLSKGKRPHMMYTVSIGQNPTGATVPQDRRREIYDICSEFDVIIVEDEPYWFLQYDGNEKCYLNIDKDGRVLRLDSFSKCFVPGARMGWVTGQPELIRRIFFLAEEATQMPSGFSQMLIHKTLTEWGPEGWMQWLSNLRNEYRERRDAMVGAISKYADIDGQRVLEYKSPQAGMFVWLRARFDLHPAYSGDNLTMAKAFWIWNTKQDAPTLINPGIMFAPNSDNDGHTSNYFRMSFAPCGKDEIIPFTESVGQAAQKFWKLDGDKIQQLATEYPTN